MATGFIPLLSTPMTIDIANYVALPASGQQNQIALINSNTIGDVYIQPEEPSSPAEGDVWIMTGWSGNVYLTFDVAKIYLTTCRQYVSGVWTVIPEWYVYTNTWTRARLYLIQNGVITGTQTFSARKWKRDSGSSTPPGVLTFTQYDSYVYIYQKNDATSAGTYRSTGICTPNFNAGQYSTVYLNMTSKCSYNSSNNRYVAIARYSDSYVSLNPIAYKVCSSSNSEVTGTYSATITQTDDPCCVYIGMDIQNNGNIAWCKIYNLYLE